MNAKMPNSIYACPRGSGTISGVWTDAKCGDEPETKYILADPLINFVNEQAEDEGLWFEARTAPEAYLQQELRRLHKLIEES